MTVAVKIHKAGTFAGHVVPDLKIEAVDEFPMLRGEEWNTLARDLHRENGRNLGQAMIDTLPGGTIDQLLLFLLEHRASLLCVRHAAAPAQESPR